MKKRIFLQSLLCLTAFGVMLYSYISTCHEVREKQALVYQSSKQLAILSEENTRLSYEIDRFEDPKNLMQLAKSKKFSHLKVPSSDEVIICSKTQALDIPIQREIDAHASPSMLAKARLAKAR